MPPKRHLTVQNQGNEHEQISSVRTRSSTKRANTGENVTVKKAKTEDEHVDKENLPTRRSNKPKVLPSVNVPEPPPLVQNINVISSSEEESEDEESMPNTSGTDDDNGKDHPANKQYVIYENDGPNKEPFVISKTARYWNRKYRKVLRHVNPDSYGMYIHSDFSCYGELEVVENCLLDLTKAIFLVQQRTLARISQVRKPADKINYILAFRRLEALTILLDFTDGISGIDDGDRFYDIMRVIGACYVTILHGLFPRVMFKKLDTSDENLLKKLNKMSKQLPNLQQVLERALTTGHTYLTIADVCSAYTKTIQMVYCNWVFMMEKTTMNLNGDKPANFNKDLWTALKHAASIDENDVEHGDKESFNFMKELQSYKVNHGLGGDSHDISKWSRSERADYSYGRFDPFTAFWF